VPEEDEDEIPQPPDEGVVKADATGTSHEVPPDDVLVIMAGLIEAQGGGRLVEVIRHAHRQRGLRLFKLMTTSIPVPGGLDQGLRHFDELVVTFEAVEELQPAAILVRRARSDMESAIDASLVGRHSTVADEMRDVMEVEHLLRDFAARHENMTLWVTCDDDTRAKKFQPFEVRRRLANDAWPSKGLDLPDKREYAVHSMGLHPTPDHPHSTKEVDAGADPSDLLSGAGEILEHCRRVFDACDVLLDSFDVAPENRPRRWPELTIMAGAWDWWRNWIEQAAAQVRAIDADMLPERGPSPRKKAKPSSPSAS
jgi:hypothetical protein